jgi:PiT family inorganic phosphate transporter
MVLATAIFLSSGLFMGWSLGANDAANIFGTAVSTKMVRFRTAALICSVFVVLGAVISGAGPSHTLGKLGAVNAMPGAFAVAFSAAFTVMWMTRLCLPVSTSQAIVGAIVGWNLFSGTPTHLDSLYQIMGTWLFSPLLAAVVAVIIYRVVKHCVENTCIHILLLDKYTRTALLLVGAFGSYSLGASNIANVMGVFVHSSPFQDLRIAGSFQLSGIQQLFLLGGLAIAAGVVTYSKRVMLTVGSGIYRLSPVTAFVVVLSVSTVMFLFASETLKTFLTSCGLPSLPLVPVSQSQAVVGAIMGVGLAKGGRNINYMLLKKIGLGWVATPVSALIISYICLFILQNAFMQRVFI